ncbi:MAG: dihydroorotate dehydrogenase-like protein [Dysgonamonadaceae bacterium]|jgi:dihydroorotate dehydrogenase (fumarate)|nr:dihydroorotate dehydrogenase-like protein [Dysgonamonadaceae bacterium]
MTKIFETAFAGLTLPNPVIIASSGLTDTVNKNKELEKAGAGAIILKSLFEEQITGKQDNDVDDYLHLIQGTKEQCSIPVIASVFCSRSDYWIDFAHQIEVAGADAIEINVFALNTDLSQAPDSLENAYIHIIQKLKEVVNIPVIIKLGKYFSHILHLVDRLHAAGVAGVVLFNRFYQTDIDINKLQMTSGNVFSSSSEVNDTLRWIGIINGRLPEASIAAATGVHDWEDIVKCILMGASAVQICSTLYQNGNEIIAAMKRSLEEWMVGMNFHSIEAFKGKLNYALIEDPSLYERQQFLRYFSNRD